MADAATLICSVNARGKTIQQWKLVFDTGSSDVTPISASAGNHQFLMGLFGIDATAYNLTIKTGATSLAIAENPASMGLAEAVDPNKYILCSRQGEALIFNSSTAAPSVLVVHVCVKDVF